MMYNLQVLLNRRPMQRLYRTPNSSQVLASEDSYQKKKKKKKRKTHTQSKKQQQKKPKPKNLHDSSKPGLICREFKSPDIWRSHAHFSLSITYVKKKINKKKECY